MLTSDILLLYRRKMTSMITFPRLISTFALLCFTDFGDFLESRHSVINCPPFHAILDNLIHVWIGILTWSVVTDDPWILSQDLIIVALGASFIDVDHFLAARSLSMDQALSAGHRGIFHCTGLAPLISVILLKYKPKSALLFVVAVFPHHFRDAQRRGLYLIPFTHAFDTPPLYKGLVRILLPIFPWILFYFRKHFDDTSGTSTHSRIFDV